MTNEQMASFLNDLLPTKADAETYAGIVFQLDYPGKELLVAWPKKEPVSTRDSLRALLQGSNEVANVT